MKTHIIKPLLATLVAASTIALGTVNVSALTESDFQVKIDECVQTKDIAHEMAECARKLGFAEDSSVIKMAQDIWVKQNTLQKTYNIQLKDQKAKTAKRMKEYPNATEIYQKLRAKGVPEIATCAIIGNIMREVGGDTLNVYPTIYGGGGSYYGMCQWSLYYNPGVRGKSVDGQIDYLMSTIANNMKMFGGSYDYFISITDVGTAAQYFNNYYERGAHNSQRASNARKAYEYFNS